MKLINDVIDLSSLEFGKIQFSIAKHDVVGICRNVTDTVSKVKQTQAEIHFITEQESMEIETDDSRLQQVLINLLINATKFTPQGSIILEVKKGSKEELLFSVTDTGLGLSICQLIIEQLGGKIWIDPDYDKGARFLFTHPIRHAQIKKEEAR